VAVTDASQPQPQPQPQPQARPRIIVEGDPGGMDAGPHDEGSMVELLGLAGYDLWRSIRHAGWGYRGHLLSDVAKLLQQTVPIAAFLTFFLGGAISIHAISAISEIGAGKEVSAAILSSLALRSVALIMIFMALAASLGAGTVTEFGAMRVSEEVDALESISVDSHAYLVGNRLLAAVLIAPFLTIIGVGSCFLGGLLTAVLYPDMNFASYSYFFWRTISPIDFVYVIIEMTVISAVIAVICASQGYRAQGGPVGVGLAVGRSMDLVIGVSMVLNLAFSYFFWGTTDTVQL